LSVGRASAVAADHDLVAPREDYGDAQRRRRDGVRIGGEKAPAQLRALFGVLMYSGQNWRNGAGVLVGMRVLQKKAPDSSLRRKPRPCRFLRPAARIGRKPRFSADGPAIKIYFLTRASAVSRAYFSENFSGPETAPPCSEYGAKTVYFLKIKADIVESADFILLYENICPQELFHGLQKIYQKIFNISQD
jgi:hypothetical protein